VAEIIEAGSAAAGAAGGTQNVNDSGRSAATAASDRPATATAATVGGGRGELAADGAGVNDGLDGTYGADAGSDDDESDGTVEAAPGSHAGNGGAPATGRTDDLLVREGDLAGDYLERLLDLLDYDGDIDLDVEAGRAIVSIDGGDDLQKLVGQNGVVLEALQELTRLAVQQDTGVRSRLMLDVAQWRAGRRTELAEIGRDAARRALSSGNSVKLAPMTPFERKIVHDAVARVTGVHSESEGEEPRRRVVVFRTV
jgi:spoIIIJ-associated protein